MTKIKSYTIKILIIALSLSFSGVLYIRWKIFPLGFTKELGYLLQIPSVYWVLLSIISLLLCLLNILSDKKITSLVSTIIFYLMIGFYHFLFRGTSGGGWDPRRVGNARFSSHINADLPYVYQHGQFPNHYILHRIQYLVIETDFDIIIGVELTFFVYIALFGIATWIFCKFHISNYASIFFAASLYLIVVFPIGLRFRYVPQFFALILLIYLFSVHLKTGVNWLMIKLLLFIGLILSHPMMFIYYLAAVIIYPLVFGFWQSISSLADSESESTYTLLKKFAFNPLIVARSGVESTVEQLRLSSWRNYASLLIVTYFSIYTFQFIFWQREMYSTLTATGWGAIVAPIERILVFTGFRKDSQVFDQASTQFLYELTTYELSLITSIGSAALVVVGSMILLYGYLFMKFSFNHPFHGAILIVSAIHFFVGNALGLYPQRSLQIIFLPVIVSVVVLEDLQSSDHYFKFDHMKYAVMIMLILSLISFAPIHSANHLNNQEITGGDRSPDYYTEISGITLSQYEYSTLIQPRQKGTYHPLNLNGKKEHVLLPRVLPGVETRYTYSPTSGDLIQFDNNMYHKVRYYRHTCNFNEQNRIYDNNAQILIIYEELDCSIL